MNIKIVFTAFMVCLSVQSAFARETSLSPPAGVVTNVIGVVTVTEGAQRQTSTTPLHAGDPVREQSVIRTSENGYTKILFKDQSIIEIHASTEFKVDEFQMNNRSDRNVSFILGKGRSRSRITVPVSPKGKFKLKTHTAVIGVRGTEFYVNAQNPAQANVTVLEGKVGVASGESTTEKLIEHGFQYSLPAPGVVEGEARKLSSQEMTMVTANARRPDTTFLQAVAFKPSDTKEAYEGRASVQGFSEKFKVSDEGGKLPPPEKMDVQGIYDSLTNIQRDIPFAQDNSRSVNVKVTYTHATYP